MTGYCEGCGEQCPGDCLCDKKPTRPTWNNIKNLWPNPDSYVILFYKGADYCGTEVINEYRIEEVFNLNKEDIWWSYLPKSLEKPHSPDCDQWDLGKTSED